MTKKPLNKASPDNPDFRPIAFALDEYLKSHCNKRKGNRGSIGGNRLKSEELQESKEQE
ncbi:hypothetical protein ACOIP5_003092 [Salmonella enterica]